MSLLMVIFTGMPIVWSLETKLTLLEVPILERFDYEDFI